MASLHVDLEKGEGGLQTSNLEVHVAPASPISPKSSGESTLVGKTSTHSLVKSSHGAQHNSTSSSSVGAFFRALRDRFNAQPQEDEDEEDDEDSIVRKIHEQPNGYPRTATFLDSDENFMIYRRFGYLQSRLLLEKQDELRLLEMNLDIMEAKEQTQSPERLKSRRASTDEKKALLTDIETTWNAYSQLLSNAASMTAMNKPTIGEQQSVSCWLNNVKPLRLAECSFINCKEDLITLRPGREHAWLDSGVEKLLQRFGWAYLRQAFQSRDTRAKSDGKDGTLLYTRSRIERFVVSIITLVILVLLVIPVGVLYRLSQSAGPNGGGFECIGVLLVSTLAFSACISLFTRARRHEILAASAAYCAVLVVFVGNVGQRNGS